MSVKRQYPAINPNYQAQSAQVSGRKLWWMACDYSQCDTGSFLYQFIHTHIYILYYIILYYIIFIFIFILYYIISYYNILYYIIFIYYIISSFIILYCIMLYYIILYIYLYIYIILYIHIHKYVYIYVYIPLNWLKFDRSAQKICCIGPGYGDLKKISHDSLGLSENRVQQNPMFFL